MLGPVYGPEYLNILNLPQHKLDQAKQELQDRISRKPGFLLEDGYSNLLKYLDTPFKKDLAQSFNKLTVIDQRRKLDSKKIFTELYD